MSESNSIWTLIEQTENQIETVSLETLSRGRQLADELGGRVVTLMAGNEDPELAGELASYGADEVLFLDNSRTAEYGADFYLEAISGLITDETPSIFLCGATLTGNELATRMAARLGAGLVSECIDLVINKEGRLTATKLTHGGMISSTILYLEPGTKIATIKSGVMTMARPNTSRKAEIRVIKPEPVRSESRVHLKRVVKAAPENISLDEADVIVAAGKGAGCHENFQLLENLARRLGGIVAGSLGAVDEGWLPRKKLVGQTGTTVEPKLYIACGISGSVYHILGMRDSRFVIAINKDRNAPIFKVADMSIIGDVAEIVAAVIDKLPKAIKKTTNKNGEADNA